MWCAKIGSKGYTLIYLKDVISQKKIGNLSQAKKNCTTHTIANCHDKLSTNTSSPARREDDKGRNVTDGSGANDWMSEMLEKIWRGKYGGMI